jgi:hypothetical protein
MAWVGAATGTPAGCTDRFAIRQSILARRLYQRSPFRSFGGDESGEVLWRANRCFGAELGEDGLAIVSGAFLSLDFDIRRLDNLHPFLRLRSEEISKVLG